MTEREKWHGKHPKPWGRRPCPECGKVTIRQGRDRCIRCDHRREG